MVFCSFARRAKEKRLKKDAGRARWGQYFRGLKPNSSSPIHGGDKHDSDRESELDYNQCKPGSLIGMIISSNGRDSCGK